jgi:hypothetical protein
MPSRHPEASGMNEDDGYTLSADRQACDIKIKLFTHEKTFIAHTYFISI